MRKEKEAGMFFLRQSRKNENPLSFSAWIFLGSFIVWLMGGLGIQANLVGTRQTQNTLDANHAATELQQNRLSLPTQVQKNDLPFHILDKVAHTTDLYLRFVSRHSYVIPALLSLATIGSPRHYAVQRAPPSIY